MLCPICFAPLADDEIPGSGCGGGGGSGSEHTSGGTGTAVAAAAAGSCLSCYRQILGSAPEQVAGALPDAVRQQMAALAAAPLRVAAADASDGVEGVGVERLRGEIADFLLE